MYFFISKVKISLEMVKFPGNDLAKVPIFSHHGPTPGSHVQFFFFFFKTVFMSQVFWCCGIQSLAQSSKIIMEHQFIVNTIECNENF